MIAPDPRVWCRRVGCAPEGYETEHGVAEIMVTICPEPNPHPQPLSRWERGFFN